MLLVFFHDGEQIVSEKLNFYYWAFNRQFNTFCILPILLLLVVFPYVLRG